MNLFRKKELGQVHPGLNRHLRLWDLIILGIGAMVGTGIFTITGTAAANLAGPALIISIVIAAFCVGLSALFFAEFASRIPSTGGAYSYLYTIFGEFPAWIEGTTKERPSRHCPQSLNHNRSLYLGHPGFDRYGSF